MEIQGVKFSAPFVLEGKKENWRKKEFTALETCPERHRD
jgi:hypothetical protein